MAVLVTGAGGQLGKELCLQLGPAALPFDVAELDLTQSDRITPTIVAARPSVVIHCAAYTAVDRAESEPELCRALNAVAVDRIAAACRMLDVPLMLVSTDYVFGGEAARRTPYVETERPAPRGVYARSKYEAEQAVATWTRHWIVRTCGLYARRGDQQSRSFAGTMLRLADEGRRLRVVDDQHCSPSYVPQVAAAMLFLCGAAGGQEQAYGTYHLVNGGATTWCGFARALLKAAGREVAVEPISTAEFGAAAPRPAYSVLSNAKYARLGGPPLDDWQAALVAWAGS